MRNETVVVSKEMFVKWIGMLNEAKSNTRMIDFGNESTHEFLSEIRICCGIVQEDMQDLIK